MRKNKLGTVTVTLDDIIGGGQAIGTLDDGKKIFVWGGLPGERVSVQLTKNKSHWCEGYATEIITPSPVRVEPRDPESYLSTSPWQIIDTPTENHYKASLIEEAFELHNIVLPDPITIHSLDKRYHYRNKMEYSFWVDKNTDVLSLAFHKRGGRGKIAVDTSHLAMPEISATATALLQALNSQKIEGRMLKTALIRANQLGEVRWQLYVKDIDFPFQEIMSQLPGGEVIYSTPKSPASVITNRLTSPQEPLEDTLLGVSFRYATEGFFQINLPVYEAVLKDISRWISNDTPLVDLYSGVGSIGLSVAGENQQLTLVEQSKAAIQEMKQNIASLHMSARAVHASSEDALEYISGDSTIIVDPPRAGLHTNVIARLLSQKPSRIIYVSCNPTTQARDIALLAEVYGIRYHQGYNFFPATPHIEHVVVLDKK